jgi:hypothetical protein
VLAQVLRSDDKFLRVGPERGRAQVGGV